MCSAKTTQPADSRHVPEFSIRRDACSSIVTAFIAMFWAGALAGVSFLATPVKFQAMSLELPVALEVGKVTFALFTRCEWGLAALLGFSVLVPGRPMLRLQVAGAAGVILLVLIEAFWLLPVLDARVDAVISGIPLPASPHHNLYAMAEGAKLFLLWMVAATSIPDLGRRPVERDA